MGTGVTRKQGSLKAILQTGYLTRLGRIPGTDDPLEGKVHQVTWMRELRGGKMNRLGHSARKFSIVILLCFVLFFVFKDARDFFVMVINDAAEFETRFFCA